jgi:hypothetical protein
MSNDDEYAVRYAILQASEGSAKAGMEAFARIIKRQADAELVGRLLKLLDESIAWRSHEDFCAHWETGEPPCNCGSEDMANRAKAAIAAAQADTEPTEERLAKIAEGPPKEVWLIKDRDQILRGVWFTDEQRIAEFIRDMGMGLPAETVAGFEPVRYVLPDADTQLLRAAGGGDARA